MDRVSAMLGMEEIIARKAVILLAKTARELTAINALHVELARLLVVVSAHVLLELLEIHRENALKARAVTYCAIPVLKPVVLALLILSWYLKAVNTASVSKGSL